MSEHSMGKEVRIVLDQAAATAMRNMIDALKAEISTVKIQPSQFVSFLVADFFEAHFAKDKSIFIAEFFDSDAFYEIERKKARGRPDFEDQMARALNEARKLKSSKRGTANHGRQPIAKKSEVQSNEAV